MWIMWVHGRYIQGKGWAYYTPKGDTSWYWKKMHQVANLFKDYPKEEYRVKEGYLSLPQEQTQQFPWAKVIWNKTSDPTHSFIAWLMLSKRLPVLYRLGRFTQL